MMTRSLFGSVTRKLIGALAPHHVLGVPALKPSVINSERTWSTVKSPDPAACTPIGCTPNPATTMHAQARDLRIERFICAPSVLECTQPTINTCYAHPQNYALVLCIFRVMGQ